MNPCGKEGQLSGSDSPDICHRGAQQRPDPASLNSTCHAACGRWPRSPVGDGHTVLWETATQSCGRRPRSLWETAMQPVGCSHHGLASCRVFMKAGAVGSSDSGEAAALSVGGHLAGIRDQIGDVLT